MSTVSTAIKACIVNGLLGWLASMILPRCLAVQWSMLREHSGSTFFDGWSFYGNYDNLTWGNVTYLDQSSAAEQKLAFVNEAGNTIIRVDNVTTVAMGDKRNSIRIESKDQYDYGSLWVVDVLHIPYGCSVWPAFWTKGQDWPGGGEIDIIEAINAMDRNQMSLHTTAGCKKVDVPNTQSGATLSTDCSTDSGCVIGESKPNSYGKTFAANGGGVFATLYDTSGISMWYWPRSGIPESITSASGKPTIDLGDWGLPTAAYPSSSCDMKKFFTLQTLVFNIALCGVWAGIPSVYKGTCGNEGPTGLCYSDSVVGPGNKFDNAYFELSYVRAYTTGVVTPTSTSSSATVSETMSTTPPPRDGPISSGASPRVRALTSSLILGVSVCIYLFW